ncbi:MAG: aminotransferase class V-fold PLP-dependent enzyme [Actinomycetaceae bacterium]|nr:aminotransferase class V-fold PLP-dependent enzyme [Actinomycetaceae bacterium]
MSEQIAYLDCAATIPLRQIAQDAWLEAIEQLRAVPGNPAALHSGGRKAKRLLEDARERVAQCVGADRAEVIFTSGATESNALAIVGALRAVRQKTGRTVVQVGASDHPSSWNQRHRVEAEGGEWVPLGITTQGQIDLGQLSSQAAVVSVAAVSSEIGVIQPVRELASRRDTATIFHVDAAQALHTQAVDLYEDGIDLLTIAGHKIGAPVGIGALAIKRGTALQTDRPGGDQESRHRSGTVDVAGASALAAALIEVTEQRDAFTRRCHQLRNRLLGGLPAHVRPTTSAPTAPTIIHLSIPTAHPEALLLGLDRHGVLASAGSACHAGVTRPSRVLLEMGRTRDEALGVLRISLGPTTTEADIDAFLAALPDALEGAKALDALHTPSSRISS